MKSKEELNALKEEVDTLNKKLAELNEDELKMVSGGFEAPDWVITIDPDDPGQGIHVREPGKYDIQYIITP